MSNTNSIKRRKLLKLFPAVLLAPSALTSPAGLFGCAPRSTTSNSTIFISTWNNFKANQIASDAAKGGKSVIEALIDGISFVESDIADSSVGKGGRPDRDGAVTLDSCIMDHEGEAGGVCFMEGIEHPIQVARDVMYHTPHVLLAGEGAQKFAIERGYPLTDLLSENSKEEYKKWLVEKKYNPIPNIEQHDTIGMIGLHENRLGGGCSTSGLAYKMKGRVGDSPIIGAGLYVDGSVGSCTATGMGEIMMRNLSSFLVVELMRMGATPQEACEQAIKRIGLKYEKEKEKNQVGLVAMDKNGNYGGFSLMPGFTFEVTIDGHSENIKSKSLF